MNEQKTPKKKNLILRFLAFLVTLILIAGAIFLVANRDKLNLDSIKRYFTYKSLERNDSGQAASFPYSDSSTDIFAALESDLLVCSAGGVRLYSGGGVCYVEDAISLEAPAVEVCGNTAAVYSVGGQAVYLYRDRAQAGNLTNLEGPLLSVRLNSSGWLTVITQGNGYKAVVTLYDNELKQRMAFRFNDVFIADAVVTEDCKSLAAVSLGLKGTTMESTLSFYTLPTEQDSGVSYELPLSASYSLGNNVILELDGDSSIWCVGDYGVSVWGAESGLHSWSCQNKYLKDFAIGGSVTAMLVGKYRAGSQAELYTFNDQGVPSAGLPINEQVLDLSAAGKYIAVLTADRLDIYTQNLELYSTLQGTGGARNVLVRNDGSALLIGNNTAHLYVPN